MIVTMIVVDFNLFKGKDFGRSSLGCLCECAVVVGGGWGGCSAVLQFVSQLGNFGCLLRND